MSLHRDPEFHSPETEIIIPREPDPGPEFAESRLNPDPAEFSLPPEETPLPEAGWGPEAEARLLKDRKERRARRTRMTAILQVAAAATAGVVMLGSFGIDYLGEDRLISQTSASSSQSGELSPIDSDTYVSVTYVPTGASFTSENTGSLGMTEARAWVEAQGGDPDSMSFTGSERFIWKIEDSEDAIIVGDPDDPEHQYVAQGTRTTHYRYVDRYNAYAASEPAPGGQDEQPVLDPADDAFPRLSNLSPNGYIEFNDYGVLNEEYIHLLKGVQWYNLWSGSAYDDTSYAELPSNAEGFYYDRATNTLTLDNVHGGELDINLMGNGFKIRLIGENWLNQITVWGFYYGGSVTLTGDGSLTAGQGGVQNSAIGPGIIFNCEDSASCLMIDSGVTLRIERGLTGQNLETIKIYDSTLDQGIYYLRPLVMTAYTTGSDGELVASPAIRAEIEENGHKVFVLRDANGNAPDYVEFKVGGDDLPIYQASAK